MSLSWALELVEPSLVLRANWRNESQGSRYYQVCPSRFHFVCVFVHLSVAVITASLSIVYTRKMYIVLDLMRSYWAGDWRRSSREHPCSTRVVKWRNCLVQSGRDRLRFHPDRVRSFWCLFSACVSSTFARLLIYTHSVFSQPSFSSTNKCKSLCISFQNLLSILCLMSRKFLIHSGWRVAKIKGCGIFLDVPPVRKIFLFLTGLAVRKIGAWTSQRYTACLPSCARRLIREEGLLCGGKNECRCSLSVDWNIVAYFFIDWKIIF